MRARHLPPRLTLFITTCLGLFALVFHGPGFGSNLNANKSPLLQPSPTSELTVLTYHDIVADPGADAYAVSRSRFVAQMDYLQRHGYQPVTLSLLDKVSKKQASLPHKAVLLSFDDGLESYYQFVAPLLQIYNYPSVLSVVTGWVDGKNIPPEYNNRLIQWPQLRELSQSPLVEIISHSHDLHHGVQSNPQGNEAAAGVTRLYSPSTQQYETEKQFQQRIALDLGHSVKRLKQELNISPVGITWPYGHYDNVLTTEAQSLGLHFQLNLNDGPTKISQFPRLKRFMIMGSHTLQRFADEITYKHLNNEKQRFVEIYLDHFAEQSAENQEMLLSSLLNELKQLEVNTVLIHPFSRDTRRAFFFNEQIDIAADILNRVTHQIQAQLNIRHVYLRLPANLSNTLSLKKLLHLYTDLSRLNPFSGIVFHQHTPQQITQIKKIARHFHPRIKFGHYGPADKLSEYDFAIIPVEASLAPEVFRQKILEAKGLPTTLLFFVTGDNNGKKSLSSIIEMLRALGVQHYGYGVAFNKGLYGFNQYTNDKNANNTNKLANGTLAVFGG